MKIYFHIDGTIWGKGEETILEEHIEVEMEEDVDLWRYQYDIETQTASIKYPGMSTEEALVQLETDTLAEEAAAAAASSNT